MSHIYWKQVADDLIYGDWGNESKSVKHLIVNASDTCLTMILLLDIAISLRSLRCDNFKKIPDTLSQIKNNTKKKESQKGVKGIQREIIDITPTSETEMTAVLSCSHEVTLLKNRPYRTWTVCCYCEIPIKEGQLNLPFTRRTLSTAKSNNQENKEHGNKDQK